MADPDPRTSLPNLHALLAQRGALPPAEAVALALDLLDALLAAHAAGRPHGPPTTANVLVDATGRAHLANSADFTDTAFASAALPQDDVGAVGHVLEAMLAGPHGTGADMDADLQAIVDQARAPDAQRTPSLQALRRALSQWADSTLHAPLTALPGTPGTAANGSLDALMARMRYKSDFPAMSDSVVRIQGMASSETESIASFTNEILKDVALTNKLLRLVNSAHFAARGGSINTVSRAVSLVGFNGVRNMALSLVLLEHMRDKAHAHLIKDEFLRALMAGSIAVELCVEAHENEEAFIAAMFQNLGRMLAEFYFADEARAVRHLVASSYKPQSEARASASVLGVDFETLGLGVAKAWGLPEAIQHSMRRPRGEPPLRPPVQAAERLRWIALVANDMADILLRAPPRELELRLAQEAGLYAKTLGIRPQQVRQATAAARKKLIDMAGAMELNVLEGSAAAQLLQHPDEDIAAHPAPITEKADPPDALAPLALQATPAPVPDKGQPVAVVVPSVADMLSAGIQDISQAMVEDFKLSDVLRMILETMFRAMAFQRVVFCLRDPKAEALTGRFGLGAGVEGVGSIDTVVKAFHITLKASSLDLFSTVCLKGVDTMISDATEPRIAQRLPTWYRSHVHAPTFLLLPLVIKGKPFGLVYADKAEKGVLPLDEQELALLRTLRNQAIIAFRQSV
ncbi:HDOD domain-containing protein [Rhodoferax sp.]|uniref:HDOD domain-containing protein n=1 Tax=Rhodoferax sp. TaxID=50421 RepID=UPI0025EFA15F|nr:HDOD domain-containing protein [Rhodoferax sp.]